MIKIKNQRILVYSFIFIFLSSFIMANGICNLDKYNYIPGNKASFLCTCTSPIEENKDGFIVFLNDNGSILSSMSINSGPCRGSFFGNDFLFISGSNFTGEARFSLNNDGTGIPVNWDDVSDNTIDDFNVSGSAISECIIDFELPEGVNPIFDLGKEASLSIELKDGVTDQKIINGRCSLHIESINDIHIFSVPWNPPDNYIKTTANGEAAFEKTLNNKLLIKNTSYIVRAYCWCPTNSTEPCYFEGNGVAGTETGFKACTTSILAFSGEDKRKGEFSSTLLLFSLIIITSILFILSFLLKEKHIIISVLLLFFGFFMFPVLGNFILKITENTVFGVSGMIFYTYLNKVPYLIIIYSFIYGLYKIFNYFGYNIIDKITNKLKNLRKDL